MTRALVFLAAGLASCGTPPDERPAIEWGASVEIASGGGKRGAWLQNESDYDYVDDPAVALDARGVAAIAWVDQGRKDVLFQLYDRDGRPRHERPVNVSRTPEVFSWLPRLVLSPVHPDEVFVLWQEIVFSGGSHGGDIFFARSADGGATFGPPVDLSRSAAGDGKGRIDREFWHNGSLDLAIGRDETLYAAWTEYEGSLWLSRSTDHGASFAAPIRVAGDGAGPARAPALAIGPDHTDYLAWAIGDDDGADIRLARSSDGGRSFDAPTIVATTTGYSDAPKLAVDARGTVHVVHAESAGGPFDRYHVRYTRSRDGARTFEPGREISGGDRQPPASAAFPSLGVDDLGGVYVLWEAYPDPREPPRGLVMAHSADGGDTFGGPAIVPGSDGGGMNGSRQGLLMRKLAVNGAGEVAVVNSTLRPGESSRVWLMRGERAPREERAAP